MPGQTGQMPQRMTAAGAVAEAETFSPIAWRKHWYKILVEQHPPHGVFVCDHAGLVINKFSSPRYPVAFEEYTTKDRHP